MALTPVAIGSGAGANVGGSTTRTITTTSACAAGDAIIVCWQLQASFTSIGDGTNTYNNVAAATTANSFNSGISYIVSSAGLANGGTITLTGGSNIYWCMDAFKVVGGLGTLDVSATATQAGVTALSVGPTGATAQTIELVLASFAYYKTSSTTIPAFTAGGSYTALTAATATGALDTCGLYPEWLNTAATGTQTATGTLAAVQSSGGGVVLAFPGPVSETFPAGYGSPFGHAGQSQMQQLLARFSRRRWTRRTGIWLPQYA